MEESRWESSLTQGRSWLTAAQLSHLPCLQPEGGGQLVEKVSDSEAVSKAALLKLRGL